MVSVPSRARSRRWVFRGVLAALALGLASPPVAVAALDEYRVPITVDATGATDATPSLNAFIQSVPDGSTIAFPPASHYRIEGTIFLFRRQNLTFKGNGAEFFATTDGSGTQPPSVEYARLWPRRRSQWAAVGSSGITWRNVVVRGANPSAGFNAGYVPALEGQHAFDIFRSQGIRIDGCTVANTYGDFVAVQGTPDQQASRIVVRNCAMSRSGRQGISISGGSDITLERNNLGEIARTAFDLEANTDLNIIRGVRITDNTVGRAGGNFVSNAGASAQVDDITIARNTLKSGQALTITVMPQPGYRRRNFKIIDNVGSGTYGSPIGMIRLFRVDGAEVRGNYQRIATSQSRRALDTVEACGVVATGNEFVDALPWPAIPWSGCASAAS